MNLLRGEDKSESADGSQGMGKSSRVIGSKDTSVTLSEKGFLARRTRVEKRVCVMRGEKLLKRDALAEKGRVVVSSR